MNANDVEGTATTRQVKSQVTVYTLCADAFQSYNQGAIVAEFKIETETETRLKKFQRNSVQLVFNWRSSTNANLR